MTAVAEEGHVFLLSESVTQSARSQGFAWQCHRTEMIGDTAVTCDIPLSNDRDHFVWHMRHVHGAVMHGPKFMHPSQKKRGKKQASKVEAEKGQEMATVKATTADLAAVRSTVKRAAAKAGQEAVTVEFEFDRETKNTVRFAETGVENVIGTLYVSKRIMAQLGNPQSLKVVVTPGA